jgi:hypothetical protein
MAMRKVVIAAVLVLFIATGGWLILGGGPPAAAGEAHGGEARAQVAVTVKDRPASAEPTAKPRPRERAASKQERDALRRRILEASEARQAAAARDGTASEEGERGEQDAKARAAEPRAGEAERPDDEPPAPGNLIDRTGNHGHMVKVMNEDLMPLVDECYALARATQPALTGMLVLDVEMIGDEELGAVVESVVPGQGNEVADPSLIECVQESLLSTTLPPPPNGGRDAISLSLRLDEDEG